MAVDGFHQYAHALRRGVLADAVAQIEDLGGARSGFVCVGFAKGVQHAPGFGGDGIWGGKQGVVV